MDIGQQWHDRSNRQLSQGIMRHPWKDLQMTHAEYADFARTLPSTGLYTREEAESELQADMAKRDAALSTPHEELVKHALRRHLGSASQGSGVFGSYHDLAAGRALRTEVSTNSRPNPVRLYTGSGHHPADNMQGYHSFSEDRGTAETFADINRGKIYTASPGSVRGIRVEDYGIHSYGDEQEWLVHSPSARGLK
jgi:hypothetical protein